MALDPSSMHLSGPIPGQSLTVAPGSVPWEKPPMYTTVDQAMKFFLQSFQNEENVHEFLATMESGAPLDTVVYTILSHGFAEGKWTPSLMILLIKPVVTMLAAILKHAGIKYLPSYTPHKGKNDGVFAMLMQKKEKDKVTQEQIKTVMEDAKAKEAMPDTGTLSTPPPQSKGFMSMPAALQGAE